MPERKSGITTALSPREQFAESARTIPLNDRSSRAASMQATRPGERRSATNEPSRQYKHSLNCNGGIDALCLRCRRMIASADDEWLLLEHERRHICAGAA